MNLKRAAGFAAAALAIATTGAAAAATSASAATPSCGWGCVNIFNRSFGTYHTPNFVMDVKQQAAKDGQPIILWRTSNSDPAEDFVPSFQGLVSDFYDAGLVSAQVNLHYGDGSVGAHDEFAFELEYSPYGVDSGECVGVATTAVKGEGVTLQPCGVSANTVWITDTYDQNPFANGLTVPLINGSDTNFSHPFVMTYPANGYPTDQPRPQLFVSNLTGFSNGTGPTPVIGQVTDTQLWGGKFGVLH